MRAENRLDELWLGVKGQSNSVIAGSFRNSFRASLAPVAHRGRALITCGLFTRVPIVLKLRILCGVIAGVRLRGISSWVKRETAQTAG